nr:immunoglobulin light chain junction region [Macaca mulatta]
DFYCMIWHNNAVFF